MKKALAAAVLVAATLSAKASADVYTVVVTNLEGPEVPAPVLESVSDTLRTAFIQQGRFRIVERERLEDILKEQGLQISGCVDVACAVMVGKLAEATHVVVGKVLRTADGYRVNVRLLDVELMVTNAEYVGATTREEGLVALMREGATDLCKRYTVKCPVVQYDGEYVILPAGTAHGVAVGSRFDIVRVTKVVRDEEGRVVFRKREPVGVCEAVYVEAAGCQAKMVKAELEPRKGDVAELIQ